MKRQPRQTLPISDLIVLFEQSQMDAETMVLKDSIYLELIHFYESNHQIDNAIEVVDAAISQYKYHVDFFVLKAKLLLYTENYMDALTCVNNAEKINNHNLEIKLIKIQILSLNKDFDEAISLANGLASIVTKEELSIVYLTESYIYENMSDNEAMYNVLYKAAVLDPLNEDILNRLWTSIQTSRFYYKGIKLYQRLIDIQPFSYLSWYHLGNAYIYVGEYTKAIEAMEYSFLIKDDFEEGYLEYAELCIQEKLYQKALDSYLDVMKIVKDDTDVIAAIGNCYFLLGQHDKAEHYFNEALVLDNYNDQVYFLKAKNCLASNRSEKAIESLYYAIEIDDEVEEYFYLLAKAYRLNGNISKALRYFKKATSVCPEQSFFWKKYVAYLIELKLYSKATQVIDRSVEFTYDIELQYFSAIIEFLKENKKSGITVLEEALKEDFEKHEMIFDFGSHLKEDKDIKALISYYYRELNPIFK